MAPTPLPRSLALRRGIMARARQLLGPKPADGARGRAPRCPHHVDIALLLADAPSHPHSGDHQSRRCGSMSAAKPSTWRRANAGSSTASIRHRVENRGDGKARPPRPRHGRQRAPVRADRRRAQSDAPAVEMVAPGDGADTGRSRFEQMNCPDDHVPMGDRHPTSDYLLDLGRRREQPIAPACSRCSTVADAMVGTWAESRRQRRRACRTIGR